MQQPLVSICIPTHNRLSFFKQALKSAQRQTYNTIEIVISDNSDDNTTQKYVTTLKDERIKYYRSASRHDFLFNFDKVEQLANGKYIKYLLDDDLLKPDCVSKMVQVLEQYPKVGVVMAPLKIIDEKGMSIQPRFYFFRKMKYLYKYLNQDSYIKKEKIMNDFLTTIYPCCVPTGIMFRKSLFHSVKGFDKTFKEISDLELCMNFATKMDFYYINEFLSFWRYSHFSATISVVHKIGIELDIYYKLVHKYFLYTTSHQKAYFFASKRTVLNVLAGVRSKNPTLVFETLRTILYNDPYVLNKIILPFNLFFVFIKSLFLILKKVQKYL